MMELLILGKQFLQMMGFIFLMCLAVFISWLIGSTVATISNVKKLEKKIQRLDYIDSKLDKLLIEIRESRFETKGVK